MSEQKETLESTLDRWMNRNEVKLDGVNYGPESSGIGGSKYEQVDDINVLGLIITE